MFSQIEFFFAYYVGSVFVHSVFHLGFSYSLDHFILPSPSQPIPVMLSRSYPFFKPRSDTTLQYLSSAPPTSFCQIWLSYEAM